MEKIRKQIIELIKRSNKILLMPSTPVDGDSLGSALALYLVLKKIGKEVTVVCADPIPDAFKFLPTAKVISNEFSAAKDFIVTLDCKKSKINTIRTKLEHDKVNIILTAKKGQFSKEDVSFHHGPNKYDMIVTVDTADLEQLGRFYEDNTEMFTSLPVVNIDHHASNDNYGKINYIDIMACATTEIIIPLVEDFEKEVGKKLMDEDIATLLLAGIITDTGSFQNANTTPRSFASSAKLIKYGARQQEIIKHVFKTKNLSTLKLWGRILSKIKVDGDHRMVWSTISQKDLRETNSSPDETGGIIDELLSNAPGSEIVVLIKEKDGGIISGSVRTPNPSVDASIIADMFGGGGHTQAAGFKIKSNNLEETEQLIIQKIREFQEKRLQGATISALEEETQEVLGTTEVTPEAPINEVAETPEPTKEVEESTEVPSEVPGEAESESPKEEPIEDSSQAHQEPPKQESEEESFTDFIIKKNSDEKKETELEPDMTYKFED